MWNACWVQLPTATNLLPMYCGANPFTLLLYGCDSLDVTQRNMWLWRYAVCGQNRTKYVNCGLYLKIIIIITCFTCEFWLAPISMQPWYLFLTQSVNKWRIKKANTILKDYQNLRVVLKKMEKSDGLCIYTIYFVYAFRSRQFIFYFSFRTHRSFK